MMYVHLREFILVVYIIDKYPLQTNNVWNKRNAQIQTKAYAHRVAECSE